MQEAESVRGAVGEIMIWAVVITVFAAFCTKLWRLAPCFRGQETDAISIIKADAVRESDETKR